MILYFPKDENQRVIRYPAWHERATASQRETVIKVIMPERPEGDDFHASPKYNYETREGYWEITEIEKQEEAAPQSEIDLLKEEIKRLKEAQEDQDELIMRLLLGEEAEAK